MNTVITPTPYSIEAAHEDGRHETDPHFAKTCAACRVKWVEEVASLLRDLNGDERDLANMTAEEYSDAAEASAEAKWELSQLSIIWGCDKYDRMVAAARLSNRLRATIWTLF